jgi:hypothetical protein
VLPCRSSLLDQLCQNLVFRPCQLCLVSCTHFLV